MHNLHFHHFSAPLSKGRIHAFCWDEHYSHVLDRLKRDDDVWKRGCETYHGSYLPATIPDAHCRPSRKLYFKLEADR